MNHRRVSIALTALLIGILACNLPGGAATETPTPEENLAATITAQAGTLEAPSATPGPPTETPTITPTSTPSVPMVSVSSATNCRTGDSAAFDLLYTLKVGDKAEVVGKNTASGYWIIKYPGGQCWLWGQYATVTGDISGLPEFPAPATPTPSELAAPSNFHATSSCSPSGAIFTRNIHVNLTWTDNAPNEEGYRIYRGGNLLATLAADSTSYSDDTTILFIVQIGTPNPTPQTPPSIKYVIEAFNGNGSSKQRELSIGCP
jgi:hypothetical protein